MRLKRVQFGVLLSVCWFGAVTLAQTEEQSPALYPAQTPSQTPALNDDAATAEVSQAESSLGSEQGQAQSEVDGVGEMQGLEASASEVSTLEGIDRDQASSLYQTHYAAQQFDEALDAARYGLKLAEAELGPRHPELAPFLNHLGSALLKTEQPAEALIHFERSANLVQDGRGLFSNELFEPLMGQGYARQMLGLHDAAVDTFRRGQHIVHRNDGVLGLDQIPAIEAMANSLAALDESEDAERLRVLTFKIYSRKFGRGDPRINKGLYSLAKWYLSQGDFRQALVLYDRALVLEQKAGSDPVKMLPALRGQARIYSMRRSDSALNNALKIQSQIVQLLDEMPASADQSNAHLQLGDLLMRDGRYPEALAEYQQAQQLRVEPSGQSSLLFDQPKLIDAGPSITTYTARSDDEPPYYDFNATIGADGSPRHIEVKSTNMRGQTRTPAMQHFRKSKFRPRIVDGEFVETEGFTFRRIYPVVRTESGFSVQF